MSNRLNFQISKGKIHLPHAILFNDSYFRSNRGTKWIDDLKKGEDLGDRVIKMRVMIIKQTWKFLVF